MSRPQEKERMLNDNQRRLRRSKQSERDLGKFLLLHNGPDPAYAKITSSTGRVGHIHDLQVDVISRSYAAENKQVRLSAKLLGWWEKIISVADKHDKEPLLRIVPSNVGKHPEMHIITAERHAELLDIERTTKHLFKATDIPLQSALDTGREWC